ncbi:MAG: PSD1 domain-containing protein [Acidobacteria bacterium]|nr:PSD1 domain-containing protein [Acidobacteriota bacterium]
MKIELFSINRVFKLTVILSLSAFFVGVAVNPAGAYQNPLKEPSREGLEFFEKRIRPVLADNCFVCHSAKARKPQGGLLLDSIEGMLKGGASGAPAIVPGEPDKSLLIKAIRYSDSKLQMPPVEKLPDQVIRDFEEWVRMGAPAPRSTAQASAVSPLPSYDFEAAKKFWSFQPVKNQNLPGVKNRSWVKNPVDQFILAKLAEKGLAPVSDVGRRALIRRASYDLTGLPPAADEVDAFVNDKSPDAYEKLIDRLLGSTAYGEKWGRHWLDVVRYADTAGCNSDYPVPSAYKYRNYVIKSFNDDKPYDQFIREQIAGDLMASSSEAQKFERIVATGYLAISRRFGSRNKEFELTIDDTIDNLGKTFLGLSTGCARCHDHKFDPIPNRDYYALYGIFNSTRYAFPGQEIYTHPSGFVPLAGGKEAERSARYQKELSELDDLKEFLTAEKGYAARNKKVKQQQAATEKTTEGNNKTNEKAPADRAPDSAGTIDKRPADFDRDADNWGRASKTARMPEEVDAEIQRVKTRIFELHERPPKVEKAYAVVEGYPQNARIHRKGDRNNKGDEVSRGFLTILGGPKVPPGYQGSGRDLLANWIADPANPLTARVMVNRIWGWHFGKGLVQTTNDFGSRGRAPTHPELLDWLAARFIESGWSVRKMHKLLMLSHAYQLSSSTVAANEQIDIANDYLWRFNRRRLEGEEIRDSILALSDQLDYSMGGEHPFPPENSWHFTQHEQFFAVYETSRRSVYVMQQRLKKHPFFEIFDGADQSSTTDKRTESVTPIQALFLMNNPWMHAQSDHFAVRVGMAYDGLPRRINYAFRIALGRPAMPDEIREASDWIQKNRVDLKAAGIVEEKLNRAALASYLRVLMSSNEFLYVD